MQNKTDPRSLCVHSPSQSRFQAHNTRDVHDQQTGHLVKPQRVSRLKVGQPIPLGAEKITTVDGRGYFQRGKIQIHQCIPPERPRKTVVAGTERERSVGDKKQKENQQIPAL